MPESDRPDEDIAGGIVELFKLRAPGATPTELSKRSGQHDGANKVLPQSFSDYQTGSAAFRRMPEYKIIRGITDALNFKTDEPVLLAMARQSGRVRLDPPRGLLTSRMPREAEETLDDYPEVVSALHGLISAVAMALDRAGGGRDTDT